MQQKVKLGIGVKSEIEVCNSVRNDDFAKSYVDYYHKKLLRRYKGGSYYYDHTKDKVSIEQKIRRYLIWNVHSICHRMTLVCIDSDQAKKQLKEHFWKEKEETVLNIEGFFRGSVLNDVPGKVKSMLVEQFG